MVELRHLVYFQAVAELGSIAKAASSLHMTQPTLGRQIAQLERSVGYRLLRRTHRGTMLTPAGERFRDHVRVIFSQVERIPEILSSFEHHEQPVNLGIPPGLPPEWLPAVRAELGRTAPHIKLSLHEATSENQRSMLQNGLIDIGLVHLEPPELLSAPILTQPFGCVVRRSSRLAGLTGVRLDDLAGLRVMARSAQENPRQEVRLRAAADAAGLMIDWVFRSFSEYGELIAETSQVDAVLIGEASARRHFGSWTWVPFDPADGDNAVMRTWATWVHPDVTGLGECLAAMRAAGDRHVTA